MNAKNSWFKHYPESIARTIDIPNVSLPDMLNQTVEDYPDNVALSFYHKKVTYRELGHFSTAFGSALQNTFQMKQKDRVALMLPNCPQFPISYYGVLKAGGIITQINPMLVERELQYILADSGAETIVIYDALYPRLKAIQDETNVKNVIVVSLQPDAGPVDPDYTFEQFIQSTTETLQPVSIDPKEDIAVLQYTGGTTGRSKGAMLTHRNLVANVEQSLEFFKDEFTFGKEKCLTVIPLFHVFGMTSCMNLSIRIGAESVILPKFDVNEVLETIEKEQPTLFPGVPTMYVALTNHPNAENFNLDSIRTCNSGSAPMPVGLMKEFERKTGAKILEGYGLSESAPTTHVNPPFGERKPGSVGIGFPSTEYKIVDLGEGKTEVPFGESGEIVIKGPQVMKGYWNMPEETANTLRDGWLFTGDIAKMDEDGYVYIIDRKKDLIIASGYNIYPRDIEEVLYEHKSIMEAVVVGVPDPYRGETVKAVIVKKPGATLSEEEVISYCKDQMAPYKVPKMVEFRNELPKTSVGKILRRSIREEARQV
ncbi:long-chain-fatty-acid--CoA ligase [Pseudalkalibacillus hwajinpoensis]|uniref:Long-chain fatty acid--CoA ligase n=1 Tax=Guptibacillus hwajinpoensis TaxID=208199 RepID=A0A4U1MKZ1_9BACL|nr:long-chain fatty acid--CoA ligase [Pseudalkalibacillus hwajinpoensis]TKD71285.1 long-chain fatty acid--CoA ligase [Pseudalkalibacillus hwajinpoensis]